MLAFSRAPLDMFATIFAFGGEVVVRAAQDAEVFWFVTTAFPSRMTVVELEPGTGVAAVSIGAHPGATQAIALKYLPARRARYTC